MLVVEESVEVDVDFATAVAVEVVELEVRLEVTDEDEMIRMVPDELDELDEFDVVEETWSGPPAWVTVIVTGLPSW